MVTDLDPTLSPLLVVRVFWPSVTSTLIGPVADPPRKYLIKIGFWLPTTLMSSASVNVSWIAKPASERVVGTIVHRKAVWSVAPPPVTKALTSYRPRASAVGL